MTKCGDDACSESALILEDLKQDSNLSCPQCCSSCPPMEGNYDHWICDICKCAWEITKHDIAVGNKIDIE